MEEWEEGEGEDSDWECFEVVLPVTFVMPDGSLVTISQEVDWRNIELWYVENGDVEDEDDLVEDFSRALDNV